MIIFNYHSTTGEFVQQSMADPDQFDPGSFLIPAFATTIAPPETGENEIAVFDETENKWATTSDYRGTQYWLPDGTEHEITEIGKTVPDGALSEPPAPSLDDLRTSASDRITAWRDTEESASLIFEHAGRRWDGGKVVRERLKPTVGVARARGLPDGFFWTDADDNDVPISADELMQLDAAHDVELWQQGYAIHARQRQMKEAVAAMNEKELATFVPGWDKE